VTVMEPVDTDTLLILPVVPLPGIAMLAALSVPAPTAISLVTAAEGAFMVTAPATASEFALLMVMPLAAAGAAIVRLAQAAAISTATVVPLLTVTESPEVGGLDPPHVAALLQLPLTEATFAAARAGLTVSTPSNKGLSATITTSARDTDRKK